MIPSTQNMIQNYSYWRSREKVGLEAADDTRYVSKVLERRNVFRYVCDDIKNYMKQHGETVIDYKISEAQLMQLLHNFFEREPKRVNLENFAFLYNTHKHTNFLWLALKTVVLCKTVFQYL